MKYKNGRIPESMLVRRPARGGTCLMMPGTAVKHDRLIAIVQQRHGITLEVSGPDDAYRTFAVQVEYKRIYGRNAAAPGESSHGGDFEDEESGAVDYWNHDLITLDEFFAASREAGFEPGYFMGQHGRPYEPWHNIDRTPWAVPAHTNLSEEDDMKLIRWNGRHVFGISREAVSHVPDPARLGELTAIYGPYKDVNDAGLTAVLLDNGIHWDAVDTVLRGAGPAHLGGRYWSRLVAEGIAIRGGQDQDRKTLADVLATAEKIAAE